MSSTYDQILVALSIAIAVLASYTALDLAGRVTVACGKIRYAWLIGGAIAMGIGIWSMHFVAMLAFNLSMPIAYDVWTVILSTLPAIVASLGALLLASRPILTIGQLLIGGGLMGIGIASMHYIGMGAMRLAASTNYNPLLFALSVVIAIGASIVALWIAFQLRTQSSKAGKLPKILSAVVMGGAISGMHYTGMAAASFTPSKVTFASTMTETMPDSPIWLAATVAIATVVLLGFTLLAALVDRRMVAQVMVIKQQEAEEVRSRLFTEITLRIRRSLQLEDVLNTAVNEVRQAFNVERAVIYRFNPDLSTTTIAESVTTTWRKILGTKVHETLWEGYTETDRNGRVWVTNNIYEMGFRSERIEILEYFQIKAYMIASIMNNNELVGLLCLHQCSGPRTWQKPEIDLFKQLAIQVGIALEQANLLHELEQAQEVLRVRDRAIAAASNGIVITDARLPDNPIIFCNPAFETITGYSPEETLGRNCRFLEGRDTDRATVEEIRNAIQQQRECQVAILNYRKDGTPFWNQLTISPVRDASSIVTNYIGVQSDITERKQAEEEIRRSKETLQFDLLELLGDVEEAAKGNLTVRAEITKGEIAVVADFFNVIVESLRQIVIQVKGAAQQVNLSVGDNAGAIHQLAEEALKQAEQINCTLESLDQMVMSIQAVADSASQAATMARTASTTAKRSFSGMERTVSSILNLRSSIAETVKKVKSLGEASQQISRVVSIINHIAMQTNVLSINTSIEATKAGEEGRAFTVVAEEVGHLAAKSAEATKEIEQIVENIQFETAEVVKAVENGMTQVLEGTDLVKDAKHNLEEIITVSHQIDELVQSISTATVSQAQTSEAVATLMKQIAHRSLRTSDFSHQMSGSLQQTVEVAQQLQASVGVFKTDG